MRLNQLIKNNIVKQEVARKYHDKILKAETEVVKAITEAVSKTIPDIPEKAIKLGYINYSCDYKFEDYSNHHSDLREMGLNVSMQNSFPIKTHTYSHKIKLSPKIKKAGEKLVKARQERKEFKNNLGILLNSCTTDSKLVEIVPELKEYFKEDHLKKTHAIIPLDLINSVRKELR